MMKNRNAGFTLTEILIAMTVLIVGLVGILKLFPIGLNATRKAIEDTNAALVAESAYSALRTAARHMQPGDPVRYPHDGIASGTSFTLPTTGNAIGIPRHKDGTGEVATGTYGVLETDNTHFCRLIQQNLPDDDGDYHTAESSTWTNPNTRPLEGRPQTLDQYSFNIQLGYDTGANPVGLYDVTIRVRRANRLIKKFYSQIAIPTDTSP